jgi:hypothetical protein
VTRKRRPNDAPFRRAVMARRGAHCRVCGATDWVQAAHLWPKGQGGPSVVENGLPLCQQHHGEFDSSRLQLKRSHLDVDQIAWLRAQRWVDWDADGQPFGRGCRRFQPVRRLLPVIEAAEQQEGGNG